MTEKERTTRSTKADGSYRWVRGLTQRKIECSMKWISKSSPEAWKRTTNRCEGLQALRRWAPFFRHMTAAFFSNCQFGDWTWGRQLECLNLVDTRGNPRYLRESSASRKPRVPMIFRFARMAENDREHLAFLIPRPAQLWKQINLLDGQRITHGAISENEHIISIYYMIYIEFMKSSWMGDPVVVYFPVIK